MFPLSKLFRRFYNFIIFNNIIMDNLVFEESINSELSQSEFVDKQWLYINDNNNGSYSSQIILDTTPLSNAGGYINWSEAFIAIPLVLQLESAAIAASTTNADFVLGMKNGYFQILHSLTCDFNNGNIIQQVPFLNVFSSFKCLTSWSDGDVKNWGSVCGFAPDSSRSWIYNSIAGDTTVWSAGAGTGLCNNRLAPVVPILTPGTAAGATNQSYINSTASLDAADYRGQSNAGLLKRIQYLNYGLDANGAGTFNNGQVNLLGGTTMTAQTFMSYVNTGTANTRAVIFDAIVRLKDVADFFQKCPLLKGATMRIALNTNQCFFPFKAANLAYTAASGVPSIAPSLLLTASPTILGGGGTCPIMISQSDAGQGLEGLAPTVATTQTAITGKASLSIVRSQFVGGNFMTATIAAPITSVRLYAPCYTMSPIAEQRYLSLTPTKKVVYNDIFQYQFNDVPASNFNLLVSNGITNVRGVVVVPFLNQSSNGLTGAGNWGTASITDTLLSPFSSSGGTPDPIAITNFNIQVSGKNLFLQQLQYTYEQFYEQLVSSNQLNGSLTTSLASGLIGKEDFEFLYRYYYGNVSRSLPSEDGVAKSIQILGTISTPATAVKVNFMVFVEFEREITIDVRTGARIA
jgi:hypothetical protein